MHLFDLHYQHTSPNFNKFDSVLFILRLIFSLNFIHTAIISKSLDTPFLVTENEENAAVPLSQSNFIDRTDEVSIVVYV